MASNSSTKNASVTLDTRAELAELVKRRAELAVSIVALILSTLLL